MTIVKTKTTSGESSSSSSSKSPTCTGGDCGGFESDNREDIIIHNVEQYLSSTKVRLNHEKWQYDLDTDAFLRDLPKVRWTIYNLVP